MGNGGTRVHLTGALCVETGATRVRGEALPGRQGRLLLARLTLERGLPASREQLAALLWPAGPPTAWDAALSALASKLRTALEPTGARLVRDTGGYRLDWPADTWIDVERAAAAIDEAEGALRAGDPHAAWAPAQVGWTITARPLLPELAGEWVDAQRALFARRRLRALDCLAELGITIGEPALAVQAATDAVRLEPFRETGWRLLMRAHDAAGDPAEAVRTFDRCRRLLADELGVDPSPETRALHRALLGRSAP